MTLKSTNIKIDEDLKAAAQKLFTSLGLDMTSAINIFLRQAVKEQAIPFRIGEPEMNEETRKAIKELEVMKKHPERYKSYTDVSEMMKEILK